MAQRAGDPARFKALWGAISALMRDRMPGSPLDALLTARKPGLRLLGGTYRPGAFPVPLGPGRCRQKGHRPLPRRMTDGMLFEAVYTPAELAQMRADHCTRCHGSWQFVTPPVRQRDEAVTPA